MTTAVRIETLTVLRCSHPHPRIPGQLCNAKLAALSEPQLEHIKGVPLWCWRCHESTVFD